MTQEDFEKKLEAIRCDHIMPAAERRHRIERLEQKYLSIENPAKVHFNSAGEGLTRRQWADLTLSERDDFARRGASTAKV